MNTPFERDGYAAALIGSVVGAIAIGSFGLLAFLIPCDPNGFDCLGVGILGVFSALVLGAIGALVGCFVALRRGGHERAGMTVLWMIGLAIAAGAVAAALATLLGRFGQVLAPLVWLTPFAMPALARWMALGRPPIRKDSSQVEI